MDNIPIATLSIPGLPAREKDEVMFTWAAVKGDHTLRASIEPAAGIIVPDGSASEKTVTVKARLPPAAQGSPAWILGIAGAFAAIVVVSAVGWMALSRRRKAIRPAAEKTRDGMLSPDAALAALTNAPVSEAPGGTQPAADQPPASGPEADVGAPVDASDLTAPAAQGAPEAPAPGGEAEAPSAAAAPFEAPAPLSTGAPAASAPAVAIGAAAATEAAPLAPVAPPAPAIALNCGSCGEALEPEWKVCPACGSKIDDAAAAAPAAPAGDGSSDAAAPGFAETVAGIRKRIEVLTAMDKDVSSLQSTLDLATSFHRTGKEEKANKYLDKAREMLAELDKD
jgi:hypothetical protein